MYSRVSSRESIKERDISNRRVTGEWDGAIWWYVCIIYPTWAGSTGNVHVTAEQRDFKDINSQISRWRIYPSLCSLLRALILYPSRFNCRFQFYFFLILSNNLFTFFFFVILLFLSSRESIRTNFSTLFWDSDINYVHFILYRFTLWKYMVYYCCVKID